MALGIYAAVLRIVYDNRLSNSDIFFNVDVNSLF